MKKNKIKLDEKDLKIIQMLRDDCKMPVKNISKKIGSPITTVYSKIKKMEKTGVIKGYKAIVDDKKLGRGVTAFICISCVPGNVNNTSSKSGRSEENISKKLSEIPEIEDVYVVTGPWDIILKLKAESVEEIGDISLKRIRTIEGVMNTLTLVSIGDKNMLC